MIHLNQKSLRQKLYKKRNLLLHQNKALENKAKSKLRVKKVMMTMMMKKAVKKFLKRSQEQLLMFLKLVKVKKQKKLKVRMRMKVRRRMKMEIKKFLLVIWLSA